MKNLLNFFLKYNYWFLFVLLEIISFALLFRFNSYQGSAFFTSANFVSGAMYDAANNVTGYFHLKTINDELVQKNVPLDERSRFPFKNTVSYIILFANHRNVRRHVCARRQNK